LDPLAKKTEPLRDFVAAPSKQKIELHGFPLHVGTIVFSKRRHLRREADAVLTDSSPQFVQAAILYFLCGVAFTFS
jgi:hypothetical protein